MSFRLLTLFLIVVSTVTASAAPMMRPGSKPIGNGGELYSPTKCEWLAVELNSNFRSGNLKTGYVSQFYCRKPNTIFLSFKYLLDSDQEVAELAAESVREALGQVAKDRNWRWVKVEEEIIKAEAAAPPLKNKLPPPKKVKAAVSEEGEELKEKESGNPVEPDESTASAPNTADDVDDSPASKPTAPSPSVPR